MGKKDPRVDAYIDEAADFAKPILKKLRELVHEGCPEVEETIKWGMPSFVYEGPLASMVAFKGHCGFSFWKSALLIDEEKATEAEARLRWGASGKGDARPRITDLADLPPDRKLVSLIRKAKKLNDDGVKLPNDKVAKKPLALPEDFEAALKRKKGAKANFDAFPPSKRRDYIQWITDAKREATRLKRIETAVEWIAEGKSRNWKYEKS